MSDAEEARIAFEIDDAAALVLFDLLARFDERGKLAVQDDAERCALWLLHGALERRLVAPFAPDHADRLAAARARLRARAGEAG